MAQLLLTMAGGLLGAAGGPIGMSIGAMAGGMIGGWVDSLWMGGGKTHVRQPQFYDSRIQAASYGKIISRTYGTIRAAGER